MSHNVVRTVFGPDQEDPIDMDQELVEEIQEQQEKTVPLNRFPSGPGRAEDTESSVSEEYDEVMSYGAVPGFEGNNQMVNLSFSLPCHLNRIGTLKEDILNNKKRVRSAPITSAIAEVFKVSAVAKLESRLRSAPVEKSSSTSSCFGDVHAIIHGPINNSSNAVYDEIISFEKVWEHTKEYSINENFDQIETISSLDVEAGTSKITTNNATVCQIPTVPGEILEEISKEQLANNHAVKSLWIHPLKLCCTCLAEFYE